MKEREKIMQEIELAKMMSADIDKVYKKYAKAALKASEERAEKIKNEKYKDCTTAEELQDMYGYGEITLEEYDEGRDFLEAQEERKRQLSCIELHRNNLKEIRDRWKGTIMELREELDEVDGTVKEVDTRTAFEKLEAEERAERYTALLLAN